MEKDKDKKGLFQPGDPVEFCICGKVRKPISRKEYKNGRVRVYWRCSCGAKGIYYFRNVQGN